jgi:DNA-binding MarR family transcriptional regulator
MKLFAALRKIREFERLELFFVKSLIDFDIIIEIGYAQEQDQPLTPKQLFLMNLSSITTVRRRLKRLIDQGIVRRRRNVQDQRSALLTVSSPSLKLLTKYVGVLATVCAK